MKKSKPFNLGQFLKQCREFRGLSQTGLADLTGLQASAISHFECNRREPSLANLHKLADGLGMTLDKITGRNRFPE